MTVNSMYVCIDNLGQKWLIKVVAVAENGCHKSSCDVHFSPYFSEVAHFGKTKVKPSCRLH